MNVKVYQKQQQEDCKTIINLSGENKILNEENEKLKEENENLKKEIEAWQSICKTIKVNELINKKESRILIIYKYIVKLINKIKRLKRNRVYINLENNKNISNCKIGNITINKTDEEN